MILVTGATGRVGRLVVDELLRAGAAVRALTRQPESAALPDGVDVVAGDFSTPASLEPALDSVAAVFLVWTAPLATASAVISRLATHSFARPRRVVYLSAPFRTPHPFFQQPNPMRELHAEVERLLATSGLGVTVIRPGMFASNALQWWAPQIRQGDVVRWPYAAAETAPVDERDIAAVAARALLESRFAGGDYVLTGPESLSQAAQVHTIGDVIARKLHFNELSPDDFRRETAGIWPTAVADMLLSAWQATLGQSAYVSAHVQEILGAPARTFAQWTGDHAVTFARAGAAATHSLPNDR
ncbi:MAG TPA: NAD(P)H-binding protein [Gemmatimonadaceae bacterium]|jgi:uncharacterized protein YbjT (DUF2867 family)